MTRLSTIGFITSFFLFFAPLAAATNYTQCLVDFRNGNDTQNGTDYRGDRVDPKSAVGMTYAACRDRCGVGREPFNWSIFSQQFSAWLLPWLALVSQLPFGAESRLDNLISVILAVGSPTLAAFSLALTAVNTRWANTRFSAIEYPNHENAAKALIHLQQVPLRLTTRNGLLASLIVLPENDLWWECVVDRLEQTHTWTVAAATSIAWVLIAFIFTVIDSFMNLGYNINSNGQGVGSLWLWLVPIVVGWLWIPVCSYDKLRATIDRANDLAFVAAPNADAPRRAYDISRTQAIRIYNKKKVFNQDAARAAPVFNYARIWEWSSVVETIAQGFEHADWKARRHLPVDSRREWAHPEDKRPMDNHDNRTGTIAQVQAYCGFPIQGDEEFVQPVPPGMWKRIFVASAFAIGLQWATTGSAVIIVLFTPTTGLGCRSGSYILYGATSTLIWFAQLLSSYLAHYAKERHDRGDIPRAESKSANWAKNLATFLRRLSVLAAACNTISVILACVFQFSNFYNTCYCNASVLGRGFAHAYVIIDRDTGYYNGPMKAAWVGGVVLASG